MSGAAIVYPAMKPENVCELRSQYVSESCIPHGGHLMDELNLLSSNNPQYAIVYHRVNCRYVQSMHNLSVLEVVFM